ncbi:MAG: hypothetical protein Q7Q73_04545 [Verrucomicrobiota bacterium JB024]|nr:hypothetical protein [Verrucomicrobiota bacterium JB024]
MRLSPLIRTYILTSLCGLVLACHLSAQTQQPVFRCQLRTLGWQGVPSELYLRDGQGYEPIAIRRGKLTDSFEYRGSPTLQLYIHEPIVVEGQLPPPPDFTVRLPENRQDYILLVMPGNDSDNHKLRILPIQDSATRPPEGSLALVNTTPATLGLVIGEKKCELPPLKLEIVPLPESSDVPKNQTRKTRITVPIRIFWKGEEGWKKLRSTSLFVISGSNEFMFLHEPVWSDGLSGFAHDPIQWTMISR